MRVRVEAVGIVPVDQFAKEHGLALRVTERASPRSPATRYYANFHRVEVKEGNILTSYSGNGATPHEAITDYLAVISGRLLVKDAYKASRKEFLAPRLTADGVEFDFVFVARD